LRYRFFGKPATKASCDIRSWSIFHGTRLNKAGAAMEECMAVDVVLWLILAAAVGFIGFGCIYTARNERLQKSVPTDPAYKFGRAA
jgi:hypothetical protein